MCCDKPIPAFQLWLWLEMNQELKPSSDCFYIGRSVLLLLHDTLYILAILQSIELICVYTIFSTLWHSHLFQSPRMSAMYMHMSYGLCITVPLYQCSIWYYCTKVTLYQHTLPGLHDSLCSLHAPFYTMFSFMDGMVLWGFHYTLCVSCFPVMVSP